jgi:hypothetical protein
MKVHKSSPSGGDTEDVFQEILLKGRDRGQNVFRCILLVMSPRLVLRRWPQAGPNSCEDSTYRAKGRKISLKKAFSRPLGQGMKISRNGRCWLDPVALCICSSAHAQPLGT